MEDSRLEKDFYYRTHEQDEELGLNDMRVENYQQPEVIPEEAEVEGEGEKV